MACRLGLGGSSGAFGGAFGGALGGVLAPGAGIGGRQRGCASLSGVGGGLRAGTAASDVETGGDRNWALEGCGAV